MWTRRNPENDIKTGGVSINRDKSTGEIRMLRWWCPAYSGREFVSGSSPGTAGTGRYNVKGEMQVTLPDSAPNCETGGGARGKAKPFTIYKWDVLRAWELVKANQGTSGIDGQSIDDFESKLKDNLYKLWNRLSSGSYYPPAVKGVAIPKKSG